MRHILPTPGVGLLGAVLFWTPSIVLHAIRANTFSSRDVLTVTVLLPLVTLSAFEIASRLQVRMVSHRLSPILAILGIWLFGPLCVSTEWIFSGGGLARADGLLLVAMGTVFFPVFTFIMSTYDGTLGAVLIKTVGLLIRAAANKRLTRHPVDPPPKAAVGG